MPDLTNEPRRPLDYGPQRRAHALLGQLLDRGERGGLPIIEWNIATHGLITGRCFHPDHDQRPDELTAWAAALGMHRWPDSISPGNRRVHAVREDLIGSGVDVVIVGDIRTKDDQS